jgi:hypothetical protein
MSVLREPQDENRSLTAVQRSATKNNVRTLIKKAAENDQALRLISETREAELEEEAQQERDSRVLEQLDEQQGRRLRDVVDDALARID